MSTRRYAAEKYYDCLQCAEQCRHADYGNPSGNISGSGNNNNSVTKNSGCGGSGVISRIRGARRLPTTNVALYGKDVSSPPLDDVKKTRNGRTSLSKSLSRHQSAHLTPAKKRSSLARPVRVHDSFVQPRRLMATDEHSPRELIDEPDHQEQVLQDQASAISYKNPWWWQEQHQRDQQPNTSSYAYGNVEERAGEDGAGWPIRLRLEQMLELTLPQTKRKKKKKKKTAAAAAATMVLMKQQQRSRHGFKDTERLLKVLSINNVDQDNRYNIKRCSVM